MLTPAGGAQEEGGGHGYRWAARKASSFFLGPGPSRQFPPSGCLFKQLAHRATEEGDPSTRLRASFLPVPVACHTPQRVCLQEPVPAASYLTKR